MQGHGHFRWHRLSAALIVLLFAGLAAKQAAAVSLNPIGAIKDAIESVLEDRASGDIRTDLRIKTEIVAALFDKMAGKVIAIGVDVYEQDVMLTGAVENEVIKVRAGELVSAIQGVKKLHNEILVINPLDQDKGAVESFVDDTVIETKINALLLDAAGVNVTNFRYRSIKGHVFLFGRALSDKEKDKATNIVRAIENVKSVKNLAKVRAKE